LAWSFYERFDPHRPEDGRGRRRGEEADHLSRCLGLLGAAGDACRESDQVCNSCGIGPTSSTPGTPEIRDATTN
jgi:hypothetical protein